MSETRRIPAVHPGEVLEKEFLEPYEVSQSEVAKAIQVDARRINEIVRRKRGVTADTALRLAKYFDTSPGFWMNLQRQYDLRTAEAEIGAQIERDVQPLEDIA